MKNLPTYDQYLDENYLPYFGVKQAIDDSAKFKANENPTADFYRVYAMSPTWWAAWEMENGEKYEITQDAFTKTYEVRDKKTDEVIFVYDYGRYKIFTDKKPQIFVLKSELTPTELDKAQNVDVADPNNEIPDPKLPPTEKESEAEGEKETDKTEEEE
jgi:hypothetical protein